MQEENNIPACVGIIMDGNRRWAREQGKEPMEGHAAGYEKLKEVVAWIAQHGIQYGIFYAFSSENWKRSEKEVQYLFSLFRQAASQELEVAHKEQVCVRFIGDRSTLPEDIRQSMAETEQKTANYTRGTIVLAVSYGGRAEILNAVNTLLSQGKTDVDEAAFQQALWTHDIPDPDLIIRTGGEQRLSNFLTWQAVYSELAFVDTYWPALTREEFDAVIKEYAHRERRKGA